MEKLGSCPLCGREYLSVDKRTHHHVLPKLWYNGKGPLVEVCRACHSEFNHNNPMDSENRWSKKDALWRWIRFCKAKGKEAFNIYPELLEEVVG